MSCVQNARFRGVRQIDHRPSATPAACYEYAIRVPSLGNRLSVPPKFSILTATLKNVTYKAQSRSQPFYSCLKALNSFSTANGVLVLSILSPIWLILSGCM